MSNVQLMNTSLPQIKNLSSVEIPSGVKQIKAPELWQKGITGKGIVVAVLDTGCDKNHQDLRDQIIGGRNFTMDDGGDMNNYMDYQGHGTHVAGTIAAKVDGRGVVGVAPEAKLLIVKVLDRNGSGSYEALIKAIDYAREQNVDIISMSLGGPQDVPQLRDAIRRAVDADIIVVCAAANAGDGRAETSEYAYPGYYSEVTTVGAIDIYRNIARFSNSNDQVDLVAPGVNILSTLPGNRYGNLSGTSMATPHVSGALALLLQWGRIAFGRDLTELELYAQLIKRTVSQGMPKTQEGNGMLYLTAQDELEKLVKNIK